MRYQVEVEGEPDLNCDLADTALERGWQLAMLYGETRVRVRDRVSGRVWDLVDLEALPQ